MHSPHGLFQREKFSHSVPDEFKRLANHTRVDAKCRLLNSTYLIIFGMILNICELKLSFEGFVERLATNLNHYSCD